MNKEKESEKLYYYGKDNYQKIKETAEKKVIEWRWSKGSLTDFEPFYNEEKKYPKSKKLKTAPQDKNYHTQYGVDSLGNIIVERDFNSIDFYETFYQIGVNKIISFHYSYGKEKEIINSRIYFFEDRKIKKISSSATYAIANTIYIYKNNLLVEKEEERYERETKETSNKIVYYEYDEFNILNGIRSGNYYRYQRKIAVSFSKLKQELEKRIISLLKQHINECKPVEKIFTIYLGYDCQNYFPPSISYGTEEELNNWLKKKDSQDYIWNCAEYKYSYDDIGYNKQDEQLFEQINQEVLINEKNNLAVKSIINIAIELKNSLSKLDLNITDDFVIVASDYEQMDLKKNFKKINSEKFSEFKEYLP
ncbi:hypothetical protein [Tenacibaculum finnmarkense]|uniref:hypothetical protein n=2 Tax=Tenacibaculum finnmarkense TaxID=2781243 RepID=UPI002301B5A3|nr:hypothetical protein [Tenacibaculum finnmarkense]WCC47213.1 hypothetical protein PJH08_00335 [Tenacibaculum finnmarkense]